MKKKVLHIINSMHPGGAEILLVNSLAPNGLSDYTENHIAFFMYPSYLLDRLAKDVKIHFLDYKGIKTIFRLISEINKIIIENKIDVVHSHLTPASLYTHIACPKNIPHVHTIHSTYSMDTEQSIFKLWAERYFFLTSKNANIILLSDFTKNDFLKTVPFKGKSFVLNNFVNDDFFEIQANHKLLSAKKQLKIIAIGTLKTLKNFEYLLEVFKHIKNENISLDIYGSGDKESYETIIKEKGLNIRMMGHSQNLKDIITNYNLFIMPSKFEGYPLSVFEAMAAGLPLMLSNIAPLKSIVKEHAIYFELDNAKETANTINAIFDNIIDVKTLAEKAKIFAEQNVRRDKYIKSLLYIYDTISK